MAQYDTELIKNYWRFNEEFEKDIKDKAVDMLTDEKIKTIVVDYKEKTVNYLELISEIKELGRKSMELRDEKNKRNNKPRKNSSNILNESEFYTSKSKGNNDYKYQTSIKYFNSVRRGFHPTQKPAQLLEYLIKTYTNEGDVVLDNCMGSGSTGVACLKTGRRFIGIELNDKYF